jgi:hypothetical protein
MVQLGLASKRPDQRIQLSRQQTVEEWDGFELPAPPFLHAL